MRNIRAILDQAGLGLSTLVKVSVWLTDKADFAAFNTVYREYFPDRPPARSTVVSDLLIAGAKVEIDAIAFAGRSEEHTSELQSLMRISYAVFCLKNNI